MLTAMLSKKLESLISEEAYPHGNNVTKSQAAFIIACTLGSSTPLPNSLQRSRLD